LSSRPYLPVGQQRWPIDILESTADVFDIATFHYTHRTEKDRKLQIPHMISVTMMEAHIYGLVETYSDGRHKNLVNEDSLRECSKARCTIFARAKREPEFEILVPLPNERT
jgi:hypothetical protein